MISALVLASQVDTLRPALEKWLGPLPQVTVTVADDPKLHGHAAKGAITVEPNASDFVVAHELCHQAFGEAPPHVTEGVCQQVAGLITGTEPWNGIWSAYVAGGGHELPIDSPRWPSEPARVAHLYGKAPQHFEELRKKIGDDDYARQLRDYVKHPCADCEFQPEKTKKTCGCASTGLGPLVLLALRRRRIPTCSLKPVAWL